MICLSTPLMLRRRSLLHSFACALFVLCTSFTNHAGAVPLAASFTSSATAVCQDSCLTFTSTSTGTIDSIRWKMIAFGTPVMMSNKSPLSLCVDGSFTPCTYIVRLMLYSGTSADSSSMNIIINAEPHTKITRFGHTLSVAAGYASYQWYDGATPISGATSATYTYSSSGDYNVLVSTGSCAGYSDTLSLNTLTVSNGPRTDNSYWIAQTCASGIIISADQQLNKDLHIDITDQLGRRIATDTWVQGSTTHIINTAELPNSNYYIQLSNTNIRRVLQWTKM